MMKLFLITAVLLFSGSTLSAKELPIHRIWVSTDGSIIEGNYPMSLLATTTAQTKLNMDAYDNKHRPHLMSLEYEDHAISRLKIVLPSKGKRHRWRWNASQKKVYIDMTLPKSQGELISDLYSVLASTAATRPEKRDAFLDIEIMKAEARAKQAKANP